MGGGVVVRYLSASTAFSDFLVVVSCGKGGSHASERVCVPSPKLHTVQYKLFSKKRFTKKCGAIL